MRQPSGQQFTVQAEIHHPPRGMQEDLPRQLEMNEQDETEYPAIEMEDAPARPACSCQTRLGLIERPRAPATTDGGRG